ncbi:DUF2637 domain-containing protein [Streptomyces sp. NPDC047315]|uniref:DUF2637 domain-containing protein n=1 Tax=Streptomyces sp. NPDC047315 TaxID=3155142 RepID=UPI0033F66C9B
MSKLPFLRARNGRVKVPKPPANTDSGVPPLTGWERFGAVLTVLLGICVGGLGFYASFDSVSLRAESWGFEQPWVLPTAIDSAIPVFTAAHLYLIRMDMALAWVRFVPWALSLVTCALNVAAGDTLWAKVAHGAISLLWVGVSEIAAHVYAVRIGAATGRRRRLGNIKRRRWLLAPRRTFQMWRRMHLWELDHDTVLKLELERLTYQAHLRAQFGRRWRRKAPVEMLLPLHLARNGVPLTETVPAGLAAADTSPTRAAAPSLNIPKPAAATPAAAPRAHRVSASVPPGEAPAAESTRPAPAPTAEQLDEAPSEEELYATVVAALEAGEFSRFNAGGDLTGASIGRILGQTPQNGRKVRNRLLTRYAAHLSDQGVAVPENFTIEDLATPTPV